MSRLGYIMLCIAAAVMTLPMFAAFAGLGVWFAIQVWRAVGHML